MRQREDLKPSGVGEHRAIPVDEAMDAAEMLENLGTGTKKQVIGIGEKHACP
jgi:hypothetical protein